MIQMGDDLRYAYFPGCSSKSTSIEYHISTIKVAEKLGIELIELEDANCCGTHNLEDYNEEVWLSLNARNMALAEELGAGMVTICSGCYLNTRKAKMMLQENSTMEEINKVLAEIEREFKGEAEVKHILDVLVNDFGLNNLEKLVERKLGLKVAPYYGCQLLRPPEITEFDNPENPQSFEGLLEVLGCQVADFSRKTDCCGATLTLIDEKIMLSMVKKILDEVLKIEADCISTICPLCHYALESSQFSLKMEEVPVLHVTQLVGLSIGLSPEELGLDRNLISTDRLLKKLK